MPRSLQGGSCSCALLTLQFGLVALRLWARDSWPSDTGPSYVTHNTYFSSDLPILSPLLAGALERFFALEWDDMAFYQLNHQGRHLVSG